MLATIALLALVPALIMDANTGYLRDDLTPTIDTGHGLMVVWAPPIFLTLSVIMMLVGRFVILQHSSFPANLWCWDRVQRHRSLILTVCFGLLALLLVILLAWSALNFVTAVPSLMIGIYVVLSSRAALLMRTN